ncbi:uncharacterized protein BT62DRAFT_934298 [Guyanagaster necrorhizus]|uniref:Uncharacterized protein n=1 Tax=Guyanagaster necrorhizus TaxID=856835 RepID=A0A9P8AQQ9_9AGAR|nr:uncharacterized protein BT62DRAFT_934298 [Guyanagaster necrorhizus MCA 3950]KAG7444126.1 hypothetical protein BT62DRAFT_934298 [Guyanagaster necrorhizus MCA 3950]
MHSRGGCWRPDGENRDILEVKTSLGTFLDASSKVTDDMSFTGTSYAPSNKKRWINETEQLATSSGLNYD